MNDILNSWIVKTKIAHRGLHGETFPENSIGAFTAAAQSGFAAELDVRPLADGKIAVFHDEGLSRMTGSDGYICTLNSEQVKALRLLKTDERIPLLSEVFEAVNGKTPLLIEIKNPNKVGAFEQSLVKLLGEYKGEFAVQSFNPYALEYLKHNAPQIIRGQLSSFFKNSNISKFKRYALKRLLFNKFTHPDFISYEFTDLPNRWVIRSGLPVLAWTIRSQEDYDAVQGLCDNIIFESFLPKK